MNFKHWILNNRFTVLLCSLLILLVVSPVLQACNASSPLQSVVVVISFNVLLLSALFAISESRRRMRTLTVLSIISVILQLSSALQGTDSHRLISYVFSISYLFIIVVLIVRHLIQVFTITADTICASLCGYLLIGTCWALVYSLIEIVLPGSFSISEAHFGVSDELNVSGSDSGFAMYYSFVTLTTLGFGDSVPVNAVSRVFTYLEAVFGQIYLAVLVARLVGLQISQSFRHTP